MHSKANGDVTTASAQALAREILRRTMRALTLVCWLLAGFGASVFLARFGLEAAASEVRCCAPAKLSMVAWSQHVTRKAGH